MILSKKLQTEFRIIITSHCIVCHIEAILCRYGSNEMLIQNSYCRVISLLSFRVLRISRCLNICTSSAWSERYLWEYFFLYPQNYNVTRSLATKNAIMYREWKWIKRFLMFVLHERKKFNILAEASCRYYPFENEL